MTLVRKKKDTDMTHGVIWKQILAFAFPLMIGNLFQQLYNTVDSIVVGNFVGKEALAAVGSTGPIINTLIGFFMGLSAGMGVAISQNYGAKNEKGVHDAVHTSLFITLVLSVLFTFLGVALVPPLLRMMSTPEDVMPGATLYLRIYFAGVIGLMFYNIGSGILRAVGDSRRPLYFLIFSAVVNTILDLVFVVGFKMGIDGVAYATVIAQALSAILSLYVLVKADGPYKVIFKDIKYNKAMARRIVHLGIPTGLQQAITSFSNVFVQGYVNQFGSACMAGWSSYNKIDMFVMLPMMSISLASTTFVGQNIGAGQIDRAKKGTRVATGMSLIVTAILMVPVMLFARELVSMFNGDVEVLSYGAMLIRLITPFYLLCCANQVYAGALRGAGAVKAPMYIMLGSFVVFRQIYLFCVSKIANTITWVALGYPFGWIVATTACLIYYYFGNWEKKCGLKNNPVEGKSA
ncbi:MAG: MATE family efflux transporter [Clostridia bacterium]|nr:MATE family efflux transporter [Clostridia bacterium]